MTRRGWTNSSIVYVNDLFRLRAYQDGDQVCFVLDDFIDLHNSPAYFLPLNIFNKDTLSGLPLQPPGIKADRFPLQIRVRALERLT
jgi:hypothetical protein